MATIIKTEESPFGENDIMVTVEGFPNAQPVMSSELSEAELQTAVDAWAVNQAEVDSINDGTATQAIIDKHAPKVPFDYTTYQKRLDVAMPDDRLIVLMPYHPATMEYIKQENWTRLKVIFQGLMQAGVLLQSDYDVINGVLKEQNVDLNSIG
jgi:hypothetical protein